MVLIAAYLGVTIAYGVAVPAFEAPDENHHFYTVRYIATERRLPRISPETILLRQEAAQPPLYYVLAALISGPFFGDSPLETIQDNPFVQLGDLNSPLNNNVFLHSSAENWPWQGDLLALHIIRLFSTMVGVGTLLCIYATGRLLFPNSEAVALLAIALVGFLPQFNALHAAVTNDVLIILFASLAIWQIVYIWAEVNQPAYPFVQLTALGVTIGFAALAKTAGLLLFVWSIVAVSMRIILYVPHSRKRRYLIYAIGQLSVLFFAICGWLLWRNWLLYADPTAANQFVLLGGRTETYSFANFLVDLERVRLSAVGVFGWMTVASPKWVYSVWNWVAILSLAAFVLHVVRIWRGELAHGKRTFLLGKLSKPQLQIGLLLLGWLGLVTAGWLRFIWETPADQGRLLFPAILPVAMFMAYGLWQLPGGHLRLFVPLILLGTTVYSVSVTVPSAFRPKIISAENIPASAEQLKLEVHPGLTLHSIDLHTPAINAGETAQLTLYWHSAQPQPELEYEVLELFGHAMSSSGKLHTFPSGGNLLPQHFPHDAIIVDPVEIRTSSDMRTPVELRLLQSWQGVANVHEIARLKVNAANLFPIGEPIVTFENGIEIVSIELPSTEAAIGTQLTVDVVWQVVANQSGSPLTTFLHLGEQTASPLAQGDAPPAGGFYPTHRWEAGERIEDQFVLPIPEGITRGIYPLYLGLYNSQDYARVALQADGVEQPHAAYLIDHVIVVGE